MSMTATAGCLRRRRAVPTACPRMRSCWRVSTRATSCDGRVGASLLKAVGLPELIADSPEEYGERLQELVAKPARLAEYREYLANTRERNPLFDTEGFTRDWEALLMRIYDEASGRAV